jgi:hypothetical protein
MMAFDTDFAPMVGQQITLTSTSPAAVGTRISLMIARAAVNECDLVVKGNLAGVQRGWVRQANGTFKSDRASDAPLTDTQLRAQAATAGQERTYTCVPFGSGTRIGIDRDLDGCLDADDQAPDDPATCLVSGTTTTTTIVATTTTTTTLVGATTTTTTSAGSTTTTTQPAGCTPVPVLDPKANVRVTAHNDAGRIRAKMKIGLAGYESEPVTVSLSDGDTPTIASQSVGTLPPLGTSGKRWKFRTVVDGVQKVVLHDLGPRQAGTFDLSVRTRRWFTAAAANQSAANTVLTVQIGNRCFTHAATRKVD